MVWLDPTLIWHTPSTFNAQDLTPLFLSQINALTADFRTNFCNIWHQCLCVNFTLIFTQILYRFCANVCITFFVHFRTELPAKILPNFPSNVLLNFHQISSAKFKALKMSFQFWRPLGRFQTFLQVDLRSQYLHTNKLHSYCRFYLFFDCWSVCIFWWEIWRHLLQCNPWTIEKMCIWKIWQNKQWTK